MVVVWEGRAAAQSALTLAEAMARAAVSTPQARAFDAREREALARVRQARSAYFPRVEFAETVQRGNQPGFVFGSLLAQRRFTAADFALDRLNQPDALTNLRTGVGAEFSAFDGGSARLTVRGAELGHQLGLAMRSGATADLAFAAARAYVSVLQGESAVAASQAAIDAAESDRVRTRARRDAGLVTEADVLAVEVHLAGVRERQSSAVADLAIARMQLNQAIGAPISATQTLAPPPMPAPAVSPDTLVQEAMARRAERRAATLRLDVASNAARVERASMLPRVGAQAGWELNGPSLLDQRGSWTVGVDVRMTLFRGFADTARLAEARSAVERAAAERTEVEQAIEVDVRSAAARLAATRIRVEVGRAALTQAREAQRILRDRYDSGLVTITDVLRAAEMVIAAEVRARASELDVVLDGMVLDRATGRL